jgi:hypothetical protein
VVSRVRWSTPCLSLPAISDDSELWFRVVEAGRLLPLARFSFFGFLFVEFGVLSTLFAGELSSFSFVFSTGADAVCVLSDFGWLFTSNLF